MGTKICWFSNCRIFMYLQVGVYLVFIWCLFWCFGVYSRWNAVKGKSAVNPYAVGVYGVLRNFEKRYKLELITRRLQVQILSPQPCENPCGVRLQGLFFFSLHALMRAIWCLFGVYCFNFWCLRAQNDRFPLSGCGRSFYPCFCACAGDRMLAIASAAASSADRIAWAYIRVVVLALAWPRRWATVVKGVPAAIWSVAFVCRKPWMLISSMPCFCLNLRNLLVK